MNQQPQISLTILTRQMAVRRGLVETKTEMADRQRSRRVYKTFLWAFQPVFIGSNNNLLLIPKPLDHIFYPQDSQSNMQFSKLALLSVTALLSATGEACKCYGSKGNLNNGATHKCCNDYHGVYSGNDCKASSISEHLSGFDRCCKGQGSDCDFPGRAAALGQEMRAVKHVEIKTALAK
ncbi:glycosyltransferase family 90 [Fusarium beomiforme]|uniref:Glycosyltransferase family 90 n=1 Tax=Fusarium beomiforme TaxID=44412 RepID=A0A9P5DR91_9HYPO|nr:glycosyltransferase family 90 [Fusarium beomiforme]